MKPPRRCEPGSGRQTRWVPPDEEWLRDQFLVQDKSMNCISKEVGTSINTVFGWLGGVGIPTRSRSEAHKGSRNSNWQGGRGGDAHYRKKAKRLMLQNEISKQCARCGTMTGRIEVHHRDGNERNNTLKNLQWLCASCHRYIHWSCGGVFDGKEVTSCAAHT